MNALKVKLHQQSAVYRNPATAEVVETYPLPPPSTIIGLIHSMLGISNQEPGSINVSIQGDYKAIYRDYQWYKQYSDKKKNTWENRPKPVTVHTLFDVDMLLHFYFPNAAICSKVKSCFENPPYYPYLGRAEDLIKIDVAEPPRMVNITHQKIESAYTKRGAYLRLEEAKRLNLRGVLYHLPSWLKEYQKVYVGKDEIYLRDFVWEALQYIESGSYIESDESAEIVVDEDGDFVWWCMQNPMEQR